MALSTDEGKARRFRRPPMRPPGSRTVSATTRITAEEKKKVRKMVQLYGVEESELLYYKSIDYLVRQYDEVFGAETP